MVATTPVPNPIVDGAARFTVLSPSLIRVEYAEDQAFTDAGTFNVQARMPATTGFTTDVVDGFRTIKTAKFTLRYKQASGRFNADNLVLVLPDGTSPAHGLHFRTDVCAMGQLCEAEDARLTGNLRSDRNHPGYTGSGFVDQWNSGYSASLRAEGITGTVAVRVRYANASGGPVTVAWAASPGDSGTVLLPALKDWQTWGVADIPLTPQAPNFTFKLSCPAGSACPMNIDAFAITASGAAFPKGAAESPPLGGWKRSLDNINSDLLLDGGFLSRDGFYVLDDSRTALWDGTSLPTPRSGDDGHHQDDYLFAYGHDYRAALGDFAALTGAPPLLPRFAFGIGFSRYFAYHDTDWENSVIPAFRSHHVALDLIGVDTDWKAPAQWNGWNWNPKYFPDPKGFSDWAHAQNVHVLLNIHPSIQTNDAQYSAALAKAGSLVDSGNAGTKLFDLGKQGQVDAFTFLHKPFIDFGMVMWLDWCCEDVFNGVPGLSPDGWVNHLYAVWPEANGKRGFAWSRAGGKLGAGQSTSGPWSDHRSTVHFTGDTQNEWWQLAMEAEFTPSEASIGLPYVSHDIGSFHAGHPADDLYTRWVQFGTFQPMLRLHSDHGDRLPWEFGAAVEAAATSFLQLREAMLPYNYTLGFQAHTTGMTMARPLWLNYPEEAEAYQHPTEYLWGDDILVAPVLTAGTTVTSQVWFPPGHWLAMTEAGLSMASFDGPGTFPVKTTLASMPVFVKAGSIVPMQSATDSAADLGATLEPRVYAGADTDYTLYEDEGEGFGYQKGQSATTQMTLKGGEFTISARNGSYPNAPANRNYRIVWSNLDAPQSVLVNGTSLASGSGAESWSYDAGTRTLQVRLTGRSVSSSLTVTAQ